MDTLIIPGLAIVALIAIIGIIFLAMGEAKTPPRTENKQPPATEPTSLPALRDEPQISIINDQFHELTAQLRILHQQAQEMERRLSLLTQAAEHIERSQLPTINIEETTDLEEYHLPEPVATA